MALAAIVPAGCSDDEPPARGSATTITATDSSRARVTSPSSIERPLPAGASIDELVGAVRRVIGPTDDLDRSLSAVIDLPVDLPSPLGTEVTSARIDTSSSGTRVAVTFGVTGTPRDVYAFYDAQLAAARMVRGEGGRKQSLHHPVDFFTYAFDGRDTDGSPDRAATAGTVEVQVPAEGAGDVTVVVDLEAADPMLLARLRAWPPSLPGLASTRVTGVGIATPSRTLAGTRPGVDLYVEYDDIVGTTPIRLERAILSALPETPYALRSRDTSSDTLRRLELQRSGRGTVGLTLSASTVTDADRLPRPSVAVTADASVAF